PPLAGRRILTTRAQHQAGQLGARLAELGADVIEIPAIEILPPKSWEPLDGALGRASEYEWLIVTSGNTVKSIVERLGALGLPASHLEHLEIAAVGPATARTLAEAGLNVSVIPEKYVAESLIEAIGERVCGARVLIVRSAIARDLIPDALTATGAQVDVVNAYRNVIPDGSIRRIAQVFAPGQQQPDAATFTSSSTVTNFFQLLRAAGVERPGEMRAVSIGPITTQALLNHGWEPAAEADPHDIQGLIDATVRALTADR
ncbi:MAG: uroporphyrinogen-III synthase, partial [Silvibacterium sp.]|nr:uroporphyrinogen-III synthase [Silvibacterium sp.]